MWLNRGTRSASEPMGDGTLEREIQGNKQLLEASRIIVVLLELHIPFTLGNPSESLVWHSPFMIWLLEQPSVCSVTFDQCMYHLRPPDFVPQSLDVRVRKRTTVVGSRANLTSLERRCDGLHSHSESIGHCSVNGRRVSRASAAGVTLPACAAASLICFCNDVPELLVSGAFLVFGYFRCTTCVVIIEFAAGADYVKLSAQPWEGI